MSTPQKPRKPRSDSKLKTLPADVQERIADWCAQDGLESACSRCAAELQLATNKSSLGEFFGWWRVQQTFARAEAFAQDVEQSLRKTFPDATPEKIAAAGQLVFTMQAANAGDTETFKDLEYLRVAKLAEQNKTRIAEAKLRQKEEELRLAERKFQRETCSLFLKWSADEAAKRIVSGSGSNADKIAALGKAMFGEDWDE